MSGLARQVRALEALEARGRLRRLMPRAGADFASNDYLGLAGSDLLRQAASDALARGVAVGAGGSRLLRGNDAEHEALEAEAAAFFGTERALYLGGGFPANLAIFSALPQHGDLVLHDALIHASAHDGMRLGRAEARSFPHNDVTAAEDAIRGWRNEGRTGQVWIAVEAVYSMDGDLAPIADLAAVAERHEAMLIVDEAHATGLFGPEGRGLAHAVAGQDNVVSLHTGGKALGVHGGLVTAAAPLVDMLVNKARSFIYATAPSPLNAALLRASLSDLATNPARREAALKLRAQAHEAAHALCGLHGFESQILPVILGDDRRTMAVAEALQARGFDVRGIRPPTVPRGTSRLRISITLNTSAEVVTDLFTALAEITEAVPA
ncbi:8-amino-7-oxononanoate synthase [Defluviimonas sp. WL0024]|uniref:8-amino-7-oxononanoate synthase n=1 Tax=Albidovulum salinarum TaxID=2984153 RepID=A0ABT2X7L1_9RHOB|nr:8-amino-7-oxononanoate synthase [Defluviimonas sp. WL0024]MCU9849942.1 8-amino-7-oxononanoate synthase [Defluviimonas sp. WL0024]